MGNSALKFAAWALIALFLLSSPAAARARERRGAPVVVTKLDGAQVAGELIAVRPDSLLLLSSGTDVSIALTDIKAVRVVRKSRALPLAIGGFLTGAGEAVWATLREPENGGALPTLKWAALIGSVQALLGGAIGLGLGADSVLPFAGERDEVIQGYLDKLKGRSLEGRRLAPLGLETGRPGPSRLHRFRLSLGGAYNLWDSRNGYRNEEGSWRFAGDVPPEEAGTFPLTFEDDGPTSWEGYHHKAHFGPIGLAYEWTKRWLAEIEWFHAAGRGNLLYAFPKFVLTADGKSYMGFIPGPPYPTDAVAFDVFLAGPDYRLIVPDRLSRVSLEVGAAAGPAFVRITPNPGLIPPDRKVALALRARVAFDYYFIPAFSLGLVTDWCYARAGFAPVTSTGELAFRDINDYSPFTPPAFVRTVEVSIPGRAVELNRFLIGARITFRI